MSSEARANLHNFARIDLLLIEIEATGIDLRQIKNIADDVDRADVARFDGYPTQTPGTESPSGPNNSFCKISENPSTAFNGIRSS